MGRSGLPTTLIICCSLPAGMPQAILEACLDVGRQVALPVTWIAAVDRLPFLVERSIAPDSCRQLALAIPSHQSRQELRHLLMQAVAAAPGLEAASIQAPLPAEHLQTLVGGGIRVLCRDRMDDIARGPRRPAPSGWPCRSAVWGLWEVTRTGAAPPALIGRVLPWGSRPKSGSLSVLDLGEQGPITGADSIRGRLERWRAWAERRASRDRVAFAALADLPALIAGGGRLPVGGSILRAA